MVAPLKEDPIVVVCGADNNYAMPLATMLCSVMANHQQGHRVEIFIIDGGIEARNRQKILDSLNQYQVTLHWVRPDEGNSKNLMTSGYITYATYYKILIPVLLPATVRKAIYLDSDVIVMADIEELWNQEIESYDMLAVQDAFIPYFSSPKGFQNYQQLGFPADRKYFNAGVLVLNLDRWRSSDLTSKILHFVTTHADRISWHDQDGLNAIVQNIGELDPRWNQQIRMYGESFSQQMDRKSYEEVIANPYIIHYLSKDKPWKWKCTHPKRNLFFHYLKLTAWADWRLPWWQVGLQVIRQISHYVRQGRWDVRQWFK